MHLRHCWRFGVETLGYEHFALGFRVRTVEHKGLVPPEISGVRDEMCTT